MDLAWQQLSEEPYRAGYRRMLKRTYLLPNQHQDVYDIKDEGVSVCVLALTPNQEVILAQQFRPGPGKILHELPGGGLEAHEQPLEAIERELLEETGYAGDLEYVGTSYHDAYSTLIRHHFVATNCQPAQSQQLDQNESIDVIIMNMESFLDLLRSGELTDTATAYKGLDYLKLL